MLTSSQKPDQTPLATLPGVAKAHAERLKQHWLETAEQVLAAYAAPNGREGLKRLLEVDEEGLRQFVEVLQHAVGPEKAACLTAPDQTHPRALGALLPGSGKGRSTANL